MELVASVTIPNDVDTKTRAIIIESLRMTVILAGAFWYDSEPAQAVPGGVRLSVRGRTNE